MQACLVTMMVQLALPSMVGQALAGTLEEALAQAYVSSPSLKAAQAELRATDEDVPAALAGWRPRLEAILGGGYVYTERAENSSQNTTFSSNNGPTAVAQLRLRQPLYDRSVAHNVEHAEAMVMVEREHLRATEQTVLLDAADAYLSLLRAEETTTAQIAYLQTLNSSVRSSQRLQERGMINEGVLAEVLSQQASAKSDVASAEATLAASREDYQQRIGAPPDDLFMPELPPGLPASAEEAARQSQRAPGVVGAQLSEAAAKESIETQLGTLYPRADLQGSVDPRSASVLGVISIPLFDPLLSPRVRQSKQNAVRTRYEAEAEQRIARVSAISAWHSMEGAEARVPALTEQVRAAERAARAAEREAMLGSRTITDMLTVQGRANRARVDLLSAECNLRLAAYKLLAAIGRLNAADLALNVTRYDPEAHHDEVKDRWFGLGSEAER